MIKQTSIDELRSKTDLLEIVSRYTTVKKNMGCCPFHDEKSPSFHIWQSKQTYKCFGCGESGNAITLIMKKERLNFVEAVEWLAAYYHIELEYDQQSQQEAQEIKDKRKEMLEVTEWAQKRYRTALEELPEDASAKIFLRKRGFNEERMKAWDYGFAPDTWDFIKTSLINMGKHQVSVECGLIVSKEGKNYDFWRNRVIVPIHDVNGVIAGLAGRIIPSNNSDEAVVKRAKWMNPAESLIYSKKKVWYGLYQAQHAIKKAGFAYIVEGYMDVQSMHDAGILNTVASCGTEVDEQQALFLKRYAEYIIICYDADKPGIKKAMKHIDLFLKLDCKVGVIEIPGEMDPDEYVNHLLQIDAKELMLAEEACEGAFAE